MKSISITVKRCARCGENHHQLEFKRIHNPIEHGDGEPDSTYWAVCPTNGDPVLLCIVEDRTKE